MKSDVGAAFDRDAAIALKTFNTTPITATTAETAVSIAALNAAYWDNNEASFQGAEVIVEVTDVDALQTDETYELLFEADSSAAFTSTTGPQAFAAAFQADVSGSPDFVDYTTLLNAYETGLITFTTAAASEGYTVTVDDGTNPAVVFEFVSWSTRGNRVVAAGADEDASATNLAAAINFAASLGLLNCAATVSVPAVTIHNFNFTAGTLAKSGANITLTTAFTVEEDVLILPAVDGVGDIFYFGMERPFGAINITVGATEGQGTYTLQYEYWDGDSWEVIPGGISGTDTDLKTTGADVFTFTPPPLWAKTAINGKTFYYIRAVLDAGTTTQNPLISFARADSVEGIAVARLTIDRATGVGFYRMPIDGGLITSIQPLATHMRVKAVLAGTSPSITYHSYFYNPVH
jgi:hypothetical protein